jgi:hypothetical protein
MVADSENHILFDRIRIETGTITKTVQVVEEDTEPFQKDLESHNLTVHFG